ncbi:pimeloyl-ACP methyl ester carboxylesterase [Actinomadura luteofluorescens]|uniref:Pimeloyl-ACP methyl ester carboxylesterase n=2 Tax=Actinomadura luteofluorescens TaxID=46163 RepID=A0A7Y9EI21_9ACTN|nr:alpha/beta hydrolase [Actinomadura luteofluorescens]NYD48180.1 pimeloyl-ACP methyl ester carboxylesterase [Actinomadura luteofluorescens]
MRLGHRILAAGVAGVAGAALVPALTVTALAGPGDTTSPVEKARADRVPTPKLDWYKCYDTAECATVRLPLDYDDPKGATTEIAVLRVRARNAKKRIGSLFVNPGGPGGQGTAIAYQAPYFLGKDVLDRFDIVGFDPRGIGFSSNVACFKSTKDQTLALAGMNVAFPVGAKQEAAYVKSAKAVGKGCSTTGKKLAGAMSTAEAARDMDVLRRAVGDKKLSYLGFSYGTAIGQYYANMFPDRLRAVVVDGVINPVSWAGTRKTENQILDDRLRSADGAYKALREILVRCGKAGRKKCQFAAYGDPVKNFDVLAKRLKAKPADIEGEMVTYADLVGGVLGALYDPSGYEVVDAMATDLWQATSPASSSAQAAKARKALAARIAERRAEVRRQKEAAEKVTAKDFPYDNSLEAFSGVTCTDGLHPKKAGSWPALTAASDRRAPYFGRAWGWGSVQCARDAWKVRDEDAYTGPFNRRTNAPVLFVGDYYDPATNYNDAVSSSKLLPNSRLLSSNSWGHTAYGTSACVTKAVDGYLVGGKLPPAGKVCVGDVQPFAGNPEPALESRGPADASAMAPQAAATGNGTKLPPVAARVPSSILLGTR